MKQVPVNISTDGNMLKLFFRDSNRCAGIIDCSTLYVLLKNWCIRLDATLTVPSHDRQARASKRTNINQTCSSRDCSIRVILYDLTKKKDAIESLLSNAELYLQHPTPTEYDRRVEYVNPHYLLRPGSRMPELEYSPTNSDSGAHQKQGEPLDQLHKNRVMHIFDLANETGSLATVEASSRLRSTLREYRSSLKISKYSPAVLTIIAINSGLWPWWERRNAAL